MLARVLTQIGEVWSRASGAQRAAVVLVALSLFGALTLISVMASRPSYRLLYGDLDEGSAAEVVAKLQEWEIPFRLETGGRSIWVGGANVDETRLRLTEEGVRPSGEVGYAELFDQGGNNFGKTELEMHINLMRAQQGEVAKKLTKLPFVKTADVMIARPQPTLFVEERKPVTASVVIVPRNGRLSEEQVYAVADFVAGAVDGLEPEHVTILDPRGRALNRQDGRLAASNHLEVQQQLETSLAERARGLLYAMVGPGRGSVEVAAQLDFQKTQETSEEFDADSAVPRKEREEVSKTHGGSPQGPASVSNALSGGVGGAAAGSTSSTQNIETDYEINRTVRTVVRDGSTIQRLSVSVVVDQTYEDRDAEIRDLVSNAVGLQPDRGDSITVAFTQALTPSDEPIPAAPSGPLNLPTSDLIRILETAGAVVALLVLFLLVRPVLKRSLGELTPPAPAVAVDSPARLGDSGEAPRLQAPGGEAVARSPEAQLDHLIDHDPEKVAKIMRNWVHKEEV